MAMTSGKLGDMKSDINITPLVDVVLVLLIIFMVVTPLLQRGYETKVPPKVKVEQAPPPMTDQVVLRIDPNGTMWINKDQFTEREFGTKLQELMRGRETRVAFFAGAGDLQWDRVAAFMDLCNENGAKNLGIVLDEMSSVGGS